MTHKSNDGSNNDKNFKYQYPNVASEWHPTKNGELASADVIFGSRRGVWSKCKNGHVWQAVVYFRNNGNGCPVSGCPVCSGKVPTPERNLEMLHQKNGDLKPSQIVPGSNKEVWWKCKNGHDWPAVVYSRKNGNGCPVCSGKRNP